MSSTRKTYIEHCQDLLHADEATLREQERDADIRRLHEQMRQDAEEVNQARKAPATAWRQKFYSGFVRCVFCRRRKTGLLWALGPDGEESTACQSCYEKEKGGSADEEAAGPGNADSAL